MLSVEGARSGYGAVPILHGVNLELAAGERVAVLGRNGMGKSTLLRTILGQLRLASGRVRIDGEDVSRLRAHERVRRGLGYVPQGRQIFPGLSVLDNLRVAAFGTRSGDVDARVDQAFEDFPALAGKRHAGGSTLSGGQQQMLAVARALMGGPRLLLLDEPSEGIQPSVLDEIAVIIDRLADRDGIAVLLVEQNLDFAERLVERVCVMEKGEIVREFAVGELTADRDLQREYMGV
jgi:urea ABC transporter ATP-binding protein UrtE